MIWPPCAQLREREDGFSPQNKRSLLIGCSSLSAPAVIVVVPDDDDDCKYTNELDPMTFGSRECFWSTTTATATTTTIYHHCRGTIVTRTGPPRLAGAGRPRATVEKERPSSRVESRGNPRTRGWRPKSPHPGHLGGETRRRYLVLAVVAATASHHPPG
jgi:hypothetical protein